jgi:hypothetical protein
MNRNPSPQDQRQVIVNIEEIPAAANFGFSDILKRGHQGKSM